MLQRKEGPGLPAPKSGWRRYWYLIRTYYWPLLALNLGFALCCLPVVTIPVALTGVNRVCIKLSRQGYVLFWQEFRDECRGSWKKSLAAGTVFGLMLLGSYYLMSLSLTNGDTIWGFSMGALGIFVLILTVMHGTFTFILIAVQDLPLGAILRNARALSALCLKQSAAIAALVCAFFAVFFLHPLIFLALFLLGGFSILQFTVCWLANGPLDDYVLKPEGS